MHLTYGLLLLALCDIHLSSVSGSNVTCKARCPNGEKIYAHGITDEGKQTLLVMHNKYRIQTRKGLVPKQPRGKNVKLLVYDNKLGRAAKNVTRTCTMKHIKTTDERWEFVGQNLYIERSSKKSKGANWEKAITKWFGEHKLYHYPNGPTQGTGHYTQIVAQNTTHVGCDYIFFYDPSRPKMPYTKLYACNYGPGGNVEGEPPYVEE